MRNQLVSVVIPSYNNETTLRQAVESALAQDVPVEVIVIDDASRIPAMETLWDLAGDHRVRILRNEQNMGASESRNRGVRAATGAFTAFLDADDWWAPGKLSAQLSVMQKKRVVLSCTARELIRPDGTGTGRVIGVPEDITYADLLRGNVINCSSALVATRVALEFPMQHDDAHEDYILWLRILKKYKRAAGLPEPYLKYRLTASGKSGNKLKSARMTYRTYRYMGFGTIRAMKCFFAYAVNGVLKYAGTKNLSGKETKR